MLKYDPLNDYLKNSHGDIVLSFGEIEKIIGEPLPASAYKHSEWWSNNDSTHTQSSAWSSEYKAVVDMEKQVVTFYKVR